ncbi:S-methyl-5'-thioadenosine phosphorylase [Novosphingobium decolorationis]|uniref:S-methyl-5'-thioadenosine phosphorylase n=1 Tax=Novosphingobium decolorationis TaxID=2698673 RepID=A0ABX8E599_9SPHN|nr:S-methyl-5'-thioadenosine phosphorylase [Novosphingobium decolorationis]QVM83366.1 S-methyl-5'-thioadenosine phosphorylase [Novosphingobium decolorationis]
MRAEKSPFWHIGVLGGSGLAAGIELEDAQEIEVASPFGKPSGPVTTGRIGNVRFTFLARHGAGHAIPPSEINYRANIDVLKRCGVTDVVSLSAIGSLREDMAPGHMVMVDQFIDRTSQRTNSFFGTGLVAHVSMADPTCARLREALGEAASLAGGHVHTTGTYVCIEGPQFSSRAESRMYQAWGADVIGMTAMPEARLAREAELPYATLGMVTDYDCWREEEEGVEVSHVLEVMHKNAEIARKTVRELARGLPERREPVGIDTALEYALITAPDARDPALVRRLDAVACRLFGEKD